MNFLDIEPSELKFLKDLGWYETEEELELLFSDSFYSYDLERISEMYSPNEGPLDYGYLTFTVLEDGSFIFQKKHIFGLNLSLKNTIPSSIKNLKKLKMLLLEGYETNEPAEKKYDDADIFAKIAPLSNLRYLRFIKTQIREIPNLAKMFPKLRHFTLDGTNLQTTPKWLFKFAQKHYSSRWYTRKGVVKEEAEVLAVLGILFGWNSCGHSINDSGNVVELKLGYWIHDWYDAIPYIPEEISRFQHLERLYINVGTFPFYGEQGDIWIPESISKLKSLRYLCTDAKYSEQLMPYLNSLDKFEVDTYEGDEGGDDPNVIQ